MGQETTCGTDQAPKVLPRTPGVSPSLRRVSRISIEKRPRIAVYCGSRVGDDPVFAEAARSVGSGLAERGADVVFGGGSVGLMGLAAEAAMAGGSHVIGVITEQLLDKEVANHAIDELRVVSDMPARKAEMYREADAFVTLPGGIGTMEEFFEVLTWRYLGLHPKPMGLVNTDGYYDPLLAFIDHSIDRGFGRQSARDLIVVGKDESILDDLLAMIPTLGEDSDPDRPTILDHGGPGHSDGDTH